MWQLRLSVCFKIVSFLSILLRITYSRISVSRIHWSNNSSKIEYLTLVQQLMTYIAVTYLLACLESTDHYCFNLYLLIFCRFVHVILQCRVWKSFKQL